MSAKKVYLKALQMVQGTNPDKAIVLQLLKEAASLGNREANYALGTWYLFGEPGVLRKNKKSARVHISSAAEGGLPDALFDYGVMLEKGEGGGKDLPGAYRSYLMAALRGDAEAIFEVGRCLYYGIGCRQSKKLSLIWLNRAAELGVGKEVDSN